jgi:hypothetical protein
MSEPKLVEAIAREIAPLAWAALGMADTLAQKNRRTASLKHAAAALSAIEREGWKVVPVEPTMDMCRAYGPDFLVNGAVWQAMLAAAPTRD